MNNGTVFTATLSINPFSDSLFYGKYNMEKKEQVPNHSATSGTAIGGRMNEPEISLLVHEHQNGFSGNISCFCLFDGMDNLYDNRCKRSIWI